MSCGASEGVQHRVSPFVAREVAPSDEDVSPLAADDRSGFNPTLAKLMCEPCGTYKLKSSQFRQVQPDLASVDAEAAFTGARAATEQRIAHFTARLAIASSPTQATRINAALVRAKARRDDLNHARSILAEEGLKFKGFSGWSNLCAERLPKRRGFSQFETVVAETSDGQRRQIPLDSRYARDRGREIDLRLSQTQHEDHAHDRWDPYDLMAVIKANTRWQISEDEEGCPCCIAGLDFDEFAAAIKELSRTNGEGEAVAGIADFGDPLHWGILLGVAAPLGLVGLAAAIRNMKGTADTFRHLDTIIQGLSKDIARLRKAGNDQDVKKLEAFKRCLTYSKRDAQFNWWVPGAVNGAASSLVLSTAFFKHPFALPVIALYATGQLGRNLYDGYRVRHHGMPVKLGDSKPVLAGKEKVNQIAKSKMRFFLSNVMGFAAFTAGALLTFVAIPAMGLFGAGAAALPVGLTLLSIGAASTGIMNNIWPRKFKPRNGDLGVSRMALDSPDAALKEIAWRQHRKKILQTGFGIYKAEGNLTKKWFKFLTALPESKDFLPAGIAERVVKFRRSWLPFLPDTGSLASQNKHKLNLDLAHKIHKDKNTSRQLQLNRLDILKKLAQREQVAEGALSDVQLFRRTFDLLHALKLDQAVVALWLNEKFNTRVLKPGQRAALEHDHSGGDCHDGHCHADSHAHKAGDQHSHDHQHAHSHSDNHNHNHNHHDPHEDVNGEVQFEAQAHDHSHSHSHKHDHVHRGVDSCGGHGNQAPGLAKRSANWSTFSPDEFWRQSSDEDRLRLQAAIDYFLFFQYPKTLAYQVYGLNDYLQQMRQI